MIKYHVGAFQGPCDRLGVGKRGGGGGAYWEETLAGG